MKEKNSFWCFLKKHRLSLLGGVFILCLVFSSGIFLSMQEQVHGKNPLETENKESSRIAVTGKNYTLNYKQEEEYKREQEKREAKIKEKPSDPIEEIKKETKGEEKKVTSIISQHSSGTQVGEEHLDGNAGESKPGQGEQKPDQGKPETGEGNQGGNGESGENIGGDEGKSKLPEIICSLKEGQTVNGGFLGFTVQAITYKKEPLNSFYVIVKVNGKKLYSSGMQHNVISYRTSKELQEGNNEISVTATDKEGNVATKNYHITVKKEEVQVEAGTMRVKLQADVLGLGTLLDETVVFYEGENLPYVVDRAFKKAGMKYKYTGTFDYGFYLQRIYKPGITNGYKIPAPILKKLEEENCSWVGFETNSLGEKDFYYWSGWLYRMDGYFPDGLSTIPAEDGSEIELLFTLNNGAEYNGTWFSGKW